MSLKEFFGFGGYTRAVEGYMSWQHLIFVSALVAVMTVCAVLLGRETKSKSEKDKNKVLIFAAVLIDLFEIFKIVVISFRESDPFHFVHDLPLFLCSIQLITIPLAAFSKGRLKEAALDFVTVFGLLGAVLGTYCAGNNYGSYPVISFDNVVSGITHCISGFTCLYIILSGMISMKKKNAPITIIILGFFSISAYIANIFTDSNYMFLSRGDGTPYDVLFDLLNGHLILYPMSVILLFVVYITVFYQLHYLFVKKKTEKTEKAVSVRN